MALPSLEVSGGNEEQVAPQRFLPAVPERGDARIHRGKKSSSKPMASQPAVTDQNVRQALGEISGLNVSEVSNQGFTSFNFRGLGDPHEGFFVQTLEDGVPISADPFGYPANYYTPPFQGLDSVEFFRGGSSLLFGPQPGGALQFRTRALGLREDRTQVRTQQILGNFGFFSSFNELSTRAGETPLRGTYMRRQSLGFRQSNQDFGVDYAQLKTARQIGSTLFTLKFDYYDAEHGEAGGLARVSSAGVAGIDQGITASTRTFDRLFIRRGSALLVAETSLGGQDLLTTRLFATDYDRLSRRQDLGGAPAFGGIAVGTTNLIQDQDFFNFGIDSRYLSVGSIADVPTRWSLGLFGFRSSSDFTQDTGATPNAESGTRTLNFNRVSNNVAVFTELEASFGAVRVVPGVRVEGIHQRIDDFRPTNPGPGRSATTWVPLLGLGAEVDLDPATGLEAYGNASQGYRPVLFQEALQLAPGLSVAGDLDPSRTASFEVGLRQGRARDFQWDASAFVIRYDNQIGRSGTQFINTGDGRHWGLDLAGDWTLGSLGAVPGQWALHGNVTWLRARFVSGVLDARTPQYAPEWLGRIRLENRIGERYRWSLGATTASAHFGDDSNSLTQAIPGYLVWDFAAEADLLRDPQLSLLVNVQNFFDRVYWSRVRGTGIDPAPPFTVQAGLRMVW